MSPRSPFWSAWRGHSSRGLESIRRILSRSQMADTPGFFGDSLGGTRGTVGSVSPLSRVIDLLGPITSAQEDSTSGTFRVSRESTPASFLLSDAATLSCRDVFKMCNGPKARWCGVRAGPSRGYFADDDFATCSNEVGGKA